MDVARHPNRLADLSGLVILVVEDDPDALDLIVTLLEGRNAKVLRAQCAAEALEKLSECRPHVLVSDIGMPGEDGYQLLERVRALPPEEGGFTPAIALTAFSQESDRRRAFAAGFWRHLAKPVDVARLCTEIACLGSSRGSDHAARFTSESNLRSERRRA